MQQHESISICSCVFSLTTTTSNASMTSFFHTNFLAWGSRSLPASCSILFKITTFLEQISSSFCCACDIDLALYFVLSTLAAITSHHTFLLLGGVQDLPHLYVGSLQFTLQLSSFDYSFFFDWSSWCVA